MAAWSVLPPSPEIQSTVSRGLHIRTKDMSKVSSTNTGKEASALIVRNLLQLATSTSNAIFVKYKSEVKARVNSFI